jgi:hypothetical protein
LLSIQNNATGDASTLLQEFNGVCYIETALRRVYSMPMLFGDSFVLAGVLREQQ